MMQAGLPLAGEDMGSFKSTLSELGFFWPSGKPDNKWPGRVFVDGFPRARLHCLNGAPGDGIVPEGRGTLHGITEDNECVTMLDALVSPGRISANKIATTVSLSVTANSMLVGNRHLDGSRTVRRVTFASSWVDRTQRLGAEDYSDLRQRATEGFRGKRPILSRQAVSYVDFARRMRIRIWRSTVPISGVEPGSKIAIDFLDLVTPDHALRVLHYFRDLLSVLCGGLIDLWNVEFLHHIGAERAESLVYFSDPIERPQKQRGFMDAPMVEFARNKPLFRKLIRNWLAEPQGRRIARAAFEDILRDKGVLRLSQHRELVTIIELLGKTKGSSPMTKAKAREVRAALRKALEECAANGATNQAWVDTIRARIDNINYHDAAIVVQNFLDELPSGFIDFPPTFAKDVVELRNTVTHNLGNIKNSDFNRLAFFVAKLRAAIALSDVISLGASPSDVRKDADLIRLADRTPSEAFGPLKDDEV
jgi:hypothetical protein